MSKKFNKQGDKITKGWGYEVIWASNEHYCGKFLVFTKKDAKFSMHFHKNKDETWFVNDGEFKLRYIDTKTATLYEKPLKTGETWHNPPLMPHQLICTTDTGSVTEVSTMDDPDDNYRVIPGDGQKAPVNPADQQSLAKKLL